VLIWWQGGKIHVMGDQDAVKLQNFEKKIALEKKDTLFGTNPILKFCSN
jgi:hypothetical protein